MAARLVGVDRMTLKGQPFSHFILPADQDTYYLHRKALLSSGADQAFELRLRHPDNTAGWVGVTMAAMAPGAPQEPVLPLVLVDISRRKTAEAEQEVLRARLEQAERLEAIGTLAGGVAHDFNNILAGILGWLSVLETEDGPAEAKREDVQEVKALVERGATLARQLLGFARRGKYDVRPLDLAAVVEKTGQYVRSAPGPTWPWRWTWRRSSRRS